MIPRINRIEAFGRRARHAKSHKSAGGRRKLCTEWSVPVNFPPGAPSTTQSVPRNSDAMRIVLLSIPEDGVIAREENFGSWEGEFYVAEDGQVCHRNRWDARVRIVNRSVAAFQQSAQAFHRYCEEVQGIETAARQPERVHLLQRELASVDELANQTDGFWALIVEQAAAGLL
jgi:hypothetical protein